MRVYNIEIVKNTRWFDLEGCEGIGDGKVGVTDKGTLVTEDGLETEPKNARQKFLVETILSHTEQTESLPFETKKRGFLS